MAASDTVNVTQEGSTVVFKGTISDPTFYDQMEKIAIREGAIEVDTSDLKIAPEKIGVDGNYDLTFHGISESPSK